MNKTASIYLDLLRFCSAILVVIFHASYARFDGGWLKSFGAYGHDAVMIFFVLSGFVIAYVTSFKETKLSDYAKSRLARLYSVVVPALILTLVLDYFGKILDPSMYAGLQYQDSDPVYRFFANIFFINELWFSSWRAFSNGPFWSLSYEFWYYVVFASWFYFSGYRRWIITAMAILIAGPKIMLLFPVWAMGVMTFHLVSKVSLNKFVAVVFAVAPLGLYIVIRTSGMQKFLLAETVELLGRDFVYTDLLWSRRFLSDYIVGALVSVHLIGVMALSKSFSFPSITGKLIRFCAGMTFAFYLFHYPLLQFFGSFVKEGVFIVILTSIAIVLLAPITEGRKRSWQIFFDKIFATVQNVYANKIAPRTK